MTFTAKDRTPFTYRIISLNDGRMYYGVKWSIGCHPEILGQTYFSSSKTVKQLIQEQGKDKFYFEVRKVFYNVNDAINWENKVLRRMKVVERDDWLNKTNNRSIQLTEENRSAVSERNHQKNPADYPGAREKMSQNSRMFDARQAKKHSEIMSERWRTGAYKDRKYKNPELASLNKSLATKGIPKKKFKCNKCGTMMAAHLIKRHQRSTKCKH